MFALLFGALLAPVPAFAASTHVALIFGNSNYKAVGSLANPANDAEDMAIALDEIGYEVTTRLDADYETMRKALAEFSRQARGAEIALIYFAGHGIEIDKHNYLIPVDAVLTSDTDVPLLTIPLDHMLTAVSGANTLRVVLLDACRNNPFLQQMRSAGTARRSLLGRGLAAVETETGTLVGFSAKEGTTASDGEGRNSPDAESLLSYIRQPRLDAGRMFRKVRDDVLRKTNRQQEPFVSSSLPREDVFLNPAGAGLAAEDAGDTATAPQAPQPDPPSDNKARLAWEAIRASTDPDDYQVFLEHFGDSIYALFARNRLEKLRQKAAPEAQTANIDPEIFKPSEPRWFLATYDNLDLFGGDIYQGGRHAASAAQCSQMCGNNLACRGYTYNARAQRCFEKNGYQSAHAFNGAVSGFFFQATSEVNPPAFSVDWEVFDHADITGIDMGDSRARSFDKCQRSCQRKRNCNGFVFVGFTRVSQCWLKRGTIEGPVYNRNAARGIISARRTERVVRPSTVTESVARN
ncbi:MAG: caspase family protein [Pseudomonadota bacterium]|nr:caspase family protein [Pseudomonadota bacterium]